jgi:hypothetical protein
MFDYIEDERNVNIRYNVNDYKDREEYLQSLVIEFGIDIEAVRMIADILGPSEDFDGLVSDLEDIVYMGLPEFDY